MKLKRVVVTGLGELTPIGNTLEEYWNGLISGKSSATPIQQFDASKFKTQFACEIKNFNVNDFIDRKDARKLDKFSQYAMVSASEAMADSQLMESRSEEHTSELQSRPHLVCRLLLEKKK